MFQVAARLTVPCPITKSRTPNFAGWTRTAFRSSAKCGREAAVGTRCRRRQSPVKADAITACRRLRAIFAAGESLPAAARQVFAVE